MARTPIITATELAAVQTFTVAGPCFLYADGFWPMDPMATVQRRNNENSAFIDATNDKGVIAVGYAPNMAYFKLEAGTYQCTKPATPGHATSISFGEE